jgi:hypothetical protein
MLRTRLEASSATVLAAMGETARARCAVNKEKSQRKAEETKCHAAVMAEVKSLRRQVCDAVVCSFFLSPFEH